MPDPIQLIPLDAIDEAALTRDRAALDPDALMELRLSIAVSGLRMPIEVFEFEEPDGPRRYGLISGFRRLAAFRALHGCARDKDRYAAVPAFVREPGSIADALNAMVEENAIRADVSPWEQAMVAITARDRRVFDTIEAAIDALYANLGRDKRRRLRTVAQLAEELDGHLTTPESLSQRQLLRLAAAAARGFGPLMRHALEESRDTAREAQWRLLLPILVESENPDITEPVPQHAHRSGRPRRLLTPRHGLRIRRELTRNGWCLHFTGRDASGELIDLVFDEIERMFSPA
jgi:ParB family transcriptional regulator, chromosome partitioning protein